MMNVPVTHLVIVAAVLVALGALGLAARRWIRRLVRQRRWLRAQDAEGEAPRLLEKLGYGVLGAQVEGGYSLQVDGQPMAVSLRADYVVERRGRRYVAEVKSGKLAPRLDTAATRRQLLEYSMAFRVDGVLLVDGEARRVHHVEFPSGKGSESESRLDRSMRWITAGAIVVAILWMLHGT